MNLNLKKLSHIVILSPVRTSGRRRRISRGILLSFQEIRMTGRKRHDEGSLMGESMVAMSLVVIGILGIISLLARSADLSHSTSHSLQATYLAAEGIEVIKNILDTDVAQHLSWGTNVKPGTYCVHYNTQTLTACAYPEDIAYDPGPGFYSADLCVASYGCPFYFKRAIEVTSNGGAFDVSSTVSWYDGGAQKSVTLEDIFQDWRQ